MTSILSVREMGRSPKTCVDEFPTTTVDSFFPAFHSPPLFLTASAVYRMLSRADPVLDAGLGTHLRRAFV